VRLPFASIILIATFACMDKPASPAATDGPKSVDAKYVLPFPVGKSYFCFQGFNSSFSHYGSFSYSVDFDMPIGTPVTAARAGVVVYVAEGFPDGVLRAGSENVVIVRHEDGTCARYVHLTTNGALVEPEQAVKAGDPIGLSGNSGESNHPHLHFDVVQSFSSRDSQTIPFDFTNMVPHPFGFERGKWYSALPY
jgi:murein DD-endopeptidase MepM/ murein hydrolase activator NlpD